MEIKSIRDFCVGDVFLRKLKITTDTMQSFALISGDTHPLHTDEEFARGNGFSGRVAYGNILGLMVSALVGMDLKSANVMLISQRLNYRAPFFINDEISLRAAIETTSEAVGVLEIGLSFENQTGQVIASGKCQVKVLGKS